MHRPEADDSSEIQRARTLLRILPAQVHRLRNALAVVQGACELAAHGQARTHAQARLALLNETLERLALLARVPAVRAEPLELQALFRGLELLLRPLERNGMRLELLCDGAAITRADGRLELHLLDLCTALAGAAAPGATPGEPRRLRLRARATPAGIALALVVRGGAVARGSFEPLAQYARACAWPCVVRASARAGAARILLPALPGTPLPAPRPAHTAQPILLLHRMQAEREILAAVLAERGHVVVARAHAPEAGVFALALVERRMAEEDPELLRRLRARPGLARVELLDERLGPDALLALVSLRT
jgi:hypothetical protein